jgi:hypothetical protein
VLKNWIFFIHYSGTPIPSYSITLLFFQVKIPNPKSEIRIPKSFRTTDNGPIAREQILQQQIGNGLIG